MLRTVTPYIPAASYHFVNGQPQASFLVFTWALTDSGGEDGGFTVVPYGARAHPPTTPRMPSDSAAMTPSYVCSGSHKANYVLPQAIREMAELRPPVVSPPVKAGSLTIFTEGEKLPRRPFPALTCGA